MKFSNVVKKLPADRYHHNLFVLLMVARSVCFPTLEAVVQPDGLSPWFCQCLCASVSRVWRAGPSNGASSIF